MSCRARPGRRRHPRRFLDACAHRDGGGDKGALPTPLLLPWPLLSSSLTLASLLPSRPSAVVAVLRLAPRPPSTLRCAAVSNVSAGVDHFLLAYAFETESSTPRDRRRLRASDRRRSSTNSAPTSLPEQAAFPLLDPLWAPLLLGPFPLSLVPCSVVADEPVSSPPPSSTPAALPASSAPAVGTARCVTPRAFQRCHQRRL